MFHVGVIDDKKGNSVIIGCYEKSLRDSCEDSRIC